MYLNDTLFDRQPDDGSSAFVVSCGEDNYNHYFKEACIDVLDSNTLAAGRKIPKFVPSFEGIRGLAVLLTMYCHVDDYSWILAASAGKSGVAIFFVLSGFLITGVLIQLQDQYTTKSISTKDGSHRHLVRFYNDRTIRLYPALCCMVFTTICVHLWMDHGVLKKGTYWNAGLVLTYTSAFRKFWRGQSLWGHTWSLCVEEYFYIMWSIILPYMRRLRIKTITSAMFLMTSFSFLISFLGCVWGVQEPVWLMDDRGPLSNFWKMMIGSMLRILPLPAWLFRKRIAWLGLLLLSAHLIISYKNPVLRIDFLEISGRKGLEYSFVVEATATVCAILLIAGSIEGNWLLETHPLRFIGKISYSFYLYQVPLLHVHEGMKGFNAVGVTCMAFVASMISTIYVEDPIRYKYRKWRER